MDHKDSCRSLLKSLSDYVDGTLGEQLCDDIERHLANCEDCRIVVDTLRKTIYLVHANSEPKPVPADVRKRLFHHLDLDEYLGN
jgi:predicted anti-sigma-YlaC factor YlaD